MIVGKIYNVVFSLKYDIEYENSVKCIKITPKSYRIERPYISTRLIEKESIMELKEAGIDV